MATTVELYEALKERVGPEAARMLSESIVAPSEVATKADIAQLRMATKADIAQLRMATKADIADLRVETHQMRTDLMRYMLGLMIPTWVAMLGMMAGMIGLFVTRVR